jgi:phage terminase large subunit-like protein
MREPAFRRYRLAQWVAPSTAWLTPSQWKDREDTKRLVSRREPMCLFFDGSFTDDSTALVGCTINAPHIFLIDLWEKPDNEDEWRVPRVDVNRVIDQTFRKYNVRELACDPFGWRAEVQSWARKYGRQRVIEFPTNVRGRMGPATDLTTEGVLEGKFTHDGSPDLMRHVLNATVTHSKYGDLIHKERSKSPHKIDAAVCAVGAYARATFHANQAKQSRGLKVVNASW